jgi:hypothetical protein
MPPDPLNQIGAAPAAIAVNVVDRTEKQSDDC